VPLIEGPEATRRFFDRLAPWYDRINVRIYRREWLERVRSEIRGTQVLDVGVGTGFSTSHLPDTIGIDLSREMLRRARYRGHLVRADVLHAPFRGRTFDTIVFAGSFYYLPNPHRGARTAAELLRPGGRVVILSPATMLLSPFVRIYSRDDYDDFMAPAGLRLIRYERLNWAACLVVAEKTAP
jgi:ubiquinone/menaquinone biosynthesis C-methylase UbiE